MISKMFIDGDFSALSQLTGLMNQYLEAKKAVPLVGASGAIFGLVIGIGALLPNVEFNIMFIPFGIKGKYLIPISIIVEYIAIMQDNPTDNVAHIGHIAGAIVGAVIMVMWSKR